MDLSAVGAYSIEMNLAQVQQAVGVSMLKGAMEVQETQAVQLIESLQAAVPSFGHQLDILA